MTGLTSAMSEKNDPKSTDDSDDLEETGEAPQAETEAAAAAPDGAAEAEAAEAVDAGPAQPADEEPAAAAWKHATSRLSGLIAWGALAASLIALAGTFWLSRSRGDVETLAARNDASLATLEASLSATRDSLDSIGGRLDELADSADTLRRETRDLERNLEQRLRQYESFPGRLANLEATQAALQGISVGNRDTWLIAEAEYYLQLANAQLQLAGNPHLAMMALRLADERILKLANPALNGVRQAISDELQALEVMDAPDVDGITMTLSSLAGVVDSLPLRQELGLPDAGTAAMDEELSGTDRALASLKRTFGGIVSVRRTDEVVKPLTAPEAQYFLRANLSLQLQAARLALLRGEQSIFETSLDDAAAWIEEYYDTSTAPVQSALDTIGEIRNSLFSVTPPDISLSLSLLRQHVVLSGAAGRGIPPEDTEPESDENAQ